MAANVTASAELVFILASPQQLLAHDVLLLALHKHLLQIAHVLVDRALLLVLLDDLALKV